MKVTVEDRSTVKKVMHIEVPEEDVTRALDEAYKELKKTAKVKGFRPGKTPRGVLERMYKNDVNADVAGKLFQEAYIDALKEIDDIFSVKDIDAYMIGPYDLSGSLGITGQVRHPEMLRVQREILAAAKRNNVAPGIFIVYPHAEAMKEYLREGYQFFVIGSDLIFLSEYSKRNANEAFAAKREFSSLK